MSDISRPATPGVQEHPALALVNSINGPGGDGDELSTPEAATAWLLEHDLITREAGIQRHCLNRLKALRGNLRDLFTTHVCGDTPKPAAIEAINRALTSVPRALLLHFDPANRFTRNANHPLTQVVEHAMALVADDAATLLTADEASILAACKADSCQWFFLRTHARRQWCSNRCGDRVRTARSYARKLAVQSALQSTERHSRSI